MVQMIKYAILVLLGGFFMLFGVHLLWASYGLSDPFSFVMTFFASNLIILISGVGVLGFGIRMVHACRGKENSQGEEKSQESSAKGAENHAG
jgi:hypothetical protein